MPTRRRKRAPKRRRLPPAPQDMMTLAAEPVPPGSGCVEYGRGAYVYMKMNRDDGSIRLLRFDTIDECRAAMAVGVAADAEAEAAEAGRSDRFDPAFAS